MLMAVVLCLLSKAFPKKSSVTKTPRTVSDSDIQGSKDAVIQDLERKLRFKEERASNGQQVCARVCPEMSKTKTESVSNMVLQFMLKVP